MAYLWSGMLQCLKCCSAFLSGLNTSPRSPPQICTLYLEQQLSNFKNYDPQYKIFYIVTQCLHTYEFINIQPSKSFMKQYIPSLCIFYLFQIIENCWLQPIKIISDLQLEEHLRQLPGFNPEADSYCSLLFSLLSGSDLVDQIIQNTAL